MGLESVLTDIIPSPPEDEGLEVTHKDFLLFSYFFSNGISQDMTFLRYLFQRWTF